MKNFQRISFKNSISHTCILPNFLTRLISNRYIDSFVNICAIGRGRFSRASERAERLGKASMKARPALATRTGGDVWHDAPARSLSRLSWSIVQEMLPITRPVAPRSSTGSFRVDFPASRPLERIVWGARFADRRIISSGGATRLTSRDYPRGIDRSISPITLNADWDGCETGVSGVSNVVNTLLWKLYIVFWQIVIGIVVVVYCEIELRSISRVLMI